VPSGAWTLLPSAFLTLLFGAADVPLGEKGLAALCSDCARSDDVNSLLTRKKTTNKNKLLCMANGGRGFIAGSDDHTEHLARSINTKTGKHHSVPNTPGDI
jgi:hypothetical protein